MLKKMAINIGGVSFVLAAIMVFASLSSILLGRLLSPGDFGEFTLMRTLILFIPPLAIWGQDLATARFFSRHEARQFRWDSAFLNIIAVATGLVGVGTAVAHFVYGLEAYKLAALFVGAMFFCSIIFFSNLMRSQARYTEAILMLQGFRGFFFFVIVMAYFFTGLTKIHAIVGYVLIIALFAGFDAWHAFRVVPRGDQPVPREFYVTGLILMGSQVAVTIMASLDSLLVPRILGYEALGLYAATLVPIQVFSILGRASKYVWVPEFGRAGSVRVKRIGLAVAGVALALLAGIVLASEPILHVLYGGKYDHGARLLQVLAFVGAGRLGYGLSSSLIVGRLGQQALNIHLKVNIAAVLLYGGLLYTLLRTVGIMGAAAALLIITILRLFTSYGIVYYFRHQLK